MVDATVNVMTVLLGVAIGVVAGLVIAFIVQGIARFFARKHAFVLESIQTMRMPLRVSLAMLAAGWESSSRGQRRPNGGPLQATPSSSASSLP